MVNLKVEYDEYVNNINEYNIMPTSIKALGERVFKNTLIESIMFMMDNYNNLTNTSFNDNAFSDSNITSFTMSEGIANIFAPNIVTKVILPP